MAENLDDKLDDNGDNHGDSSNMDYNVLEELIKSGIIISNQNIKRKPSTIPPGTFSAGEIPSVEDLRKAHGKVPTGEYQRPAETEEKILQPIDSDKYEIIEEAGRGRWGIVYKARYK